SLDYAETMHPSVGPIEEAHALYVQQLRIAERAKQTRGVFVVWDIGLGAAANAIAVLDALADIATDVVLLSFDNSTAALRFALQHADRLNYITSYVSSLESLLARREATRDRTTWRLHLGNFPDLVARVRPAPDAILFDPFSPARNP